MHVQKSCGNFCILEFFTNHDNKPVITSRALPPSETNGTHQVEIPYALRLDNPKWCSDVRLPLILTPTTM